MTIPEEIPFQSVLDALLDVDNPLPPRYFYHLSDLEEQELHMLAQIWADIPVWRRKGLLEDVEELGEKDYLLSFLELARFALGDADPQVRLPAIRTLWEYEEPSLIAPFLSMLVADQEHEVRAAAATALGKYVYLGEIEELPSERLHQIEDELLRVTNSTDEEKVRQRALEALGFSSREEVPALIEKAYASSEQSWKASALFAMGRSAHERWRPQVMEQLESQLPLIRSEAARAAGELEIEAARPHLLNLLDDPDDMVRAASIWSLSQIGGEQVRETLETLFEQTEDEEEAELIEAALDNLAFTEDMQEFELIDFADLTDDDQEADLDDDLFLDFEDEEDLDD